MKYVSRGDDSPAAQWLTRLHHLEGEYDFEIIVDAGAYIGYSALAFREWYPEAEIHAFEPVKESYEALVENVKGHNINAYRFALLDRCCEVDMGMGIESANKGTMRVGGPGNNRQKVQARRLDEIIDRVDFIKADVEGSEELLLKGAYRLIVEYSPVIQIEGKGAADYLYDLGYTYKSKWMNDHVFVKE